jgi:peroxiredoxin
MNRLIKGILPIVLLSHPFLGSAEELKQTDKPKVAVGEKAPDFKIKGPDGKVIDLAELTAKGPVLVRLNCACPACDCEQAYYREVCNAYKDQGLVSLWVFRIDRDFLVFYDKTAKDADDKVAKYSEKRKLNLLCVADPEAEAWKVFQTKGLATNILIEKGGKITFIAPGNDAGGTLAQKLSNEAARVLNTKPVDVKAKVEEEKKKEKK